MRINQHTICIFSHVIRTYPHKKSAECAYAFVLSAYAQRTRKLATTKQHNPINISHENAQNKIKDFIAPNVSVLNC